MITVVIPLYNKEAHIAHAIESVLAQSSPASEIIVVDDGSLDNGPLVVNRFVKSGIRLIKQANQGECAARNTGITSSRTPYIAFLDADDWWLPEHLSELYRLIHEYPQADFFSTSHLICRDGQMYRAKTILPESWHGIVPCFFEEYARGLSLVNSSTVCVRRKAIISIGAFPIGVKRGGDVITWIKLALNGSFAHINIPTSVYNQSAVNRTNKLREQKAPGSLLYLAKLLSSPGLDKSTKTQLLKVFNQIAFYSSAGFCLEDDRHGAKQILFLSLSAGQYIYSLKILLLLFLSKTLLSFAKKFRLRQI